MNFYVIRPGVVGIWIWKIWGGESDNGYEFVLGVINYNIIDVDGWFNDAIFFYILLYKKSDASSCKVLKCWL